MLLTKTPELRGHVGIDPGIFEIASKHIATLSYIAKCDAMLASNREVVSSMPAVSALCFEKNCTFSLLGCTACGGNALAPPRQVSTQV